MPGVADGCYPDAGRLPRSARAALDAVPKQRARSEYLRNAVIALLAVPIIGAVYIGALLRRYEVIRA